MNVAMVVVEVERCGLMVAVGWAGFSHTDS
jgi:hypothetical protein